MFFISQALEEMQQNNEYELQQLKTELIEKHEKEMQELRAELEKAQSNEVAVARKSAAESRANFTMSMDSLDIEVQKKRVKRVSKQCSREEMGIRLKKKTKTMKLCAYSREKMCSKFPLFCYVKQQQQSNVIGKIMNLIRLPN